MLWRVGSFKTLPLVMRPAFENLGPNAYPDVKYSNGKFYKVLWVKFTYHWEDVYFPLDDKDALVLTEDYSVKAVLLGGLKYD